MLFDCDEHEFQSLLDSYTTLSQRRFLAKQGISKMKDILLLKPVRYSIRRYDLAMSDLVVGEPVSLIGMLRHVTKRIVRKNLSVFQGMLITGKGEIPVTWFNQAYVKDALKNDPYMVVHGALDESKFGASFQVTSFDICRSFADAGDGQIFPTYPEIKGISNQTLCRLVQSLLTRPKCIRDALPKSIAQSESVVSIHDAIKYLHFPMDKQQVAIGMQRFIFDELMVYLYPRRKRCMDRKQTFKGVALNMDTSFIDAYLRALPYTLTGAQQRVWAGIRDDLASKRGVFRLLQGDVGSGKSDIAWLSLLAAYSAGWKGALLVPTEVLAQQHYRTCKQRLGQIGVQVILLKGKQSKKEKEAALMRLDQEDPVIVIGTHALIQEGVSMHRLGFVVIDEQHRFGVFQRQSLLDKSEEAPHCLFMSATPIPRTLVLTHYGDLDHDVIDELPPGRKPPKTYYGKPSRLGQVLEFIRLELQQGRQAYIVYPLIEASEHLDVAPAVDGYAFISDYLSEFKVGLMHGRLSEDQKDDVMNAFKLNSTQILVSTTVIEVGVDVPNASTMVIMHAERFGLSQLHQLRGRVGRGSGQAHCFLIAEANSVESKKRIKAMMESTNGFHLAQEDLAIRGPGNVLGTQQSGALVFSFANILDRNKVECISNLCDRLIQSSENSFIDYLDSRDGIVTESLN
mgnify:CR=1 FL=1|tara:strand:- start:5685 stop:7730 length:2046 start_codon:yes stop_codon:yes gene_type:complete